MDIYLKKKQKKSIAFKDYVPKFLSTHEATGLTLFPVNKLKEINGFDEFFHFWGAEDTDMHHRLRNHGLEVEYCEDVLLMLHQWHQSYLSKTNKDFAKELVLAGIEHLNHEHKDKNKELKVTKVNPNGWGNMVSQSSFEELNRSEINLHLTNNVQDVDYLINSLLPTTNNKIISLEVSDSNINKLKNTIKKVIGKKVPRYYSIKKVNDLLLMQLIAHYRNKNYIYKVSKDAQKITLKIKL